MFLFHLLFEQLHQDTFRKADVFPTVFLLLLAFSSSLAQERTVQGKVIAQEDGQPIPGVNVLVQGTARGVASDLNGIYKIQLAAGENALTFTFIGYKTQTTAVGALTTLDVTLEPETKTPTSLTKT